MIGKSFLNLATLGKHWLSRFFLEEYSIELMLNQSHTGLHEYGVEVLYLDIFTVFSYGSILTDIIYDLCRCNRGFVTRQDGSCESPCVSFARQCRDGYVCELSDEKKPFCR